MWTFEGGLNAAWIIKYLWANVLDMTHGFQLCHCFGKLWNFKGVGPNRKKQSSKEQTLRLGPVSSSGNLST